MRQTAFYCRCGARLEGASARLDHHCQPQRRVIEWTPDHWWVVEVTGRDASYTPLYEGLGGKGRERKLDCHHWLGGSGLSSGVRFVATRHEGAERYRGYLPCDIEGRYSFDVLYRPDESRVVPWIIRYLGVDGAISSARCEGTEDFVTVASYILDKVHPLRRYAMAKGKKGGKR